MKTKAFTYRGFRVNLQTKTPGTLFEPTEMVLTFRARHEVEACHALKRYLADELEMKQISVGPASGIVSSKLGREFYDWRLEAGFGGG